MKLSMQRPRRGYLMMEAMVGGAMASVILAGMLSLIAVARSKTVAAARDITANQLVTEAIEQTRSGAYPPVAAGPTNLLEAGGVYTRTIAVNSTGCPEVRNNPGSSPATTFSMACTNVTVTVSYTLLTSTRSAQASMRMYP
jgi:hypothetical protein